MNLEPYNGWSDAYRISNGIAELVVVPKIGRIMRYAFVAGPNVLWESATLKGKELDPKLGGEWQNFGGDKLWVAPQAMWNWPPPIELDGGPYVGTPILNGLKLVGPPNRRFGIHMEREITLSPKGSDVRIVNRMVNDTKYTVRRSIWQICQIDSPDSIEVGLKVSKAWPKGYHDYGYSDLPAPFREIKGDRMAIRLNPAESRKYGLASPDGAVRAAKGDLMFTISAKYEGKKDYPDEGSAQQVFTNKDPDRYAEIEFVSPMSWLKPAETRELVVNWTLGRAGSKSTGG